MKRKEDDVMYFVGRIWVPLAGNVRTLVMDGAHKSRYSIHPGVEKMYHDLRDVYLWLGMKRDIAIYVSKYLTYSKIKAEHQKPYGLLKQLEIPEWKTIQNIERIGLVAYRLKLPQELNGVHNMFHVSKLKKCLVYETLHVPLEKIQIDAKLYFIEEPMEIIDWEVKKLKRTRILIVKGTPKSISLAQSRPALVINDYYLLEHDFSKYTMGKVIEVSAILNLPFFLSKEGFLDVKITYRGGLWVLIQTDTLESKEKFINHIRLRSWFTTMYHACNMFVSDKRIFCISICGLHIKAWTTNTFKKVESIWEFLMEWEDSIDDSLACKRLCLRTNLDDIINEKVKIIIHGKVYWIRAKEIDTWEPNLDEENSNFISEDEQFDKDKGHTSGELDGEQNGEQEGEQHREQHEQQHGEQHGEQENMNVEDVNK
uniref:RNA-directed DNA polymerase, eukaryota, nucleotide-binding alpha-beta plait domain protein n=1 Tax=Tanacetum cinerariifolium TaxID=118510 RepID=A0A6L2LRV7_TANCI|nr:RNA-directed DNA polymerase, eukaryota, nucleotide-binding alpha-beta plait domain protein [Tanacetum cinerariifolium]